MNSSSTPAVTLTDMLHKFDDSKRAVANLMARENITVQVVSGADTAKFNPTTRVLVVPNWVGLTVEQCDLLMSHEIGHALFTDRKLDLSKISPGLFTYLNIIEDARIERKMKAAFPGIGPTFFKGYREFHANGPILKGTCDSLINPKTNADVKIASMKLIDRINLYYKIGAFAKCPFTAEEAKWIARIDRATSTDDCLAIARDMHKEQKESDKKPQPKNNPSRRTTPRTHLRSRNSPSRNRPNRVTTKTATRTLVQATRRTTRKRKTRRTRTRRATKTTHRRATKRATTRMATATTNPKTATLMATLMATMTLTLTTRQTATKGSP